MHYFARFDCVFPTRTARFGVALVRSGSLRLRGADMAQDVRSIDGSDVDLGSRGERGGCMFQQPPCECSTCRNYSRSYVHALLRDEASEALAAQLVTAHNVAYMMTLMRSMRQVGIWRPFMLCLLFYDDVSIFWHISYWCGILCGCFVHRRLCRGGMSSFVLWMAFCGYSFPLRRRACPAPPWGEARERRGQQQQEESEMG